MDTLTPAVAPPVDEEIQVREVAGKRVRYQPHLLFIAFLVIGAVLRVIAQLGFRPAVWYPDSFEYIGVTLRWQAYPIRPNGYSAYLWLLQPLHSITAVTFSQHLMGLGIAVAGYALLVHRGVRPWLAALAAVPVLLNPYQIQLEHLVMSDTLFLALIVAAAVVLLWRDKPGPIAAAVAGLLVAAASLTRSLGPAIIGIYGVYLVIRWVGWRGLVAFAVAAAVPMAGYSTWFHAERDAYSTTASDGAFLYSRMIVFAECDKMDLPDRLLPLCESRAPERRKPSSDYLWHPSPLDNIPPSQDLPPQVGPVELPEARFDPARNDAGREFAVEALRAQPGDYALVVLREAAYAFYWEREIFPHRGNYSLYEFRGSSKGPYKPQAGRVFVTGATWEQDTRRYANGDVQTKPVQPYANWMYKYQRYAAIPGPVLAAIFLLALVTIVARRRRDLRRPAAGMLLVTAVALLILPPATAQFDHRYVLMTIPFAAWAAAIGLSIAFPNRSESTSHEAVDPDAGLQREGAGS